MLFTTQTASAQDIAAHLEQCDADFVKRLQQVRDIGSYAEKIREKAFTHEAWKDGRLVGLVATYFNDLKDEMAFITNISVVETYAHQGIATQLLNNCVALVQEKSLLGIRLEVSRFNAAAIQFYKKSNFRVYDENDKSIFMELLVTDYKEEIL